MSEPTPAAPGRVRRFALILGADAYVDEGLPNLEGCRNDVIDAVVTLIAKGLVAQADVRPVASPVVPHAEFARRMAPWGADPQAFVEAFNQIHSHDMRPCYLRWAIAELRARMDEARAAGETPMLFLFWSGHGGLVGGRLALKLPGYFPGEAAWIRDTQRLPADIAALPEGEFERTDITYAEVIELLGLRPDESVFAVIGSCHAGAVLEGTAGADRPADMIFTAGGVDTTLRERDLEGRKRGLLNWALLRALEQFSLAEDGSLQAGMDLSFGQLLQTVRAMVLALQGNAATAWLPQVHGALRDRPELLNHRVGQVFTAPAGATTSAASNLGASVEWPPGTDGYDAFVGSTSVGSLCVTPTGKLYVDPALHAELFASSPSSLTFSVRSTMPSMASPKIFSSTKFGAASSQSRSGQAFKITKGGALIGYLVPLPSGQLEWLVVQNSPYLNSTQTYLQASFDLALTPTTGVPSAAYHQAVDDPS
ncbi:MAG: hypothetical protein KC613_19425 [Myxococcales bacterium]|nr:hypothetical protein [Myxococcales bacterium]MCB9522619.1 hypothetical protein [Myxococcales bacterium]